LLIPKKNQIRAQAATQIRYYSDGLLDENLYPSGIKVSDEEMAELNILRDDFHGEWNYTIKPKLPETIR
jgi:hypothetical protein